MANAKKVSGNTQSPMALQEAIDRALAPVKAAQRELEAKLRGAENELAGVRRERDLLKPLLIDAWESLVYCMKAEVFAAGGVHHEGARGTVYPTLQRLQAALPELQKFEASAVQQPAQPPAEADAKEDAGGESDAGENQAH